MSSAHSIHGQGRNLLEDRGVDQRVTLKWLFSRQSEKDANWNHLARYRDSWQTLVNTVMNLHIAQEVGNFLNGLPSNSFSRGTPLSGIS
jgi:hypothetical protein